MREYIDPKTTDVDEALGLLIRSLDAASMLSRSIQHPMLDDDTFGFSKGKKYARVFYNNGTQTMVAFFVQLDNGDVWKADGWKKPALNFVRGNILSPEGRAALTIGKISPTTGYFYPGIG